MTVCVCEDANKYAACEIDLIERIATEEHLLRTKNKKEHVLSKRKTNKSVHRGSALPCLSSSMTHRSKKTINQEDAMIQNFLQIWIAWEAQICLRYFIDDLCEGRKYKIGRQFSAILHARRDSYSYALLISTIFSTYSYAAATDVINMIRSVQIFWQQWMSR
jgi:hypothetical protein